MFNQQPNRPYYPTFNDNRNPYQQPYSRPHTPLSSSNLQSGGLSRSLSKLPAQNPIGFKPQNFNNEPPFRNISRSRVSMANSQVSHLSEIMNEPDVFP
jgi:hypothetical protein